jgi:hypothetical protein
LDTTGARRFAFRLFRLPWPWSCPAWTLQLSRIDSSRTMQTMIPAREKASSPVDDGSS